MPDCQNCGYRWSWKTTFKKLLLLRKEMKCPNCGSVQYISKESRNKTNLFGLLPLPIIILASAFFSIDFWGLVLLAIPLLILTLIAYPFIIRLSSKDEPMW